MVDRSRGLDAADLQAGFAKWIEPQLGLADFLPPLRRIRPLAHSLTRSRRGHR